MTQNESRETNTSDSQMERLLGLVEQLKNDFDHQKEDMQAKIADLEARLSHQAANNAINEQRGSENRSSRRRMLKQLGAAAAGVAALGVATSLRPETASAAPALQLNEVNSSTAITAIQTSAAVTSVLSVTNSGGTTGTNDAISTIAVSGAGVVGEARNTQAAGIIGYSGQRSDVDPVLGTVSGKIGGVVGASLTQAGVQGVSQQNFGVRAVSVNSVALLAKGPIAAGYFQATTAQNGPIVMAPPPSPTTNPAGAPTGGNHYLGELYLDSNYDLWVCKSTGDVIPFNPERNGIPVPQPTTATDWKLIGGGGSGGGIVFLPTPVRVSLSGFASVPAPALRSDGTQSPGATAIIIQVTGVGGIPAGAKAIFASLTSVGATASGNLRIWPNGGTTPDTNSLNIPPNPANGRGFNLTTAVVVALNSAGQVKLGYANGVNNSTCGHALDVAAYIP